MNKPDTLEDATPDEIGLSSAVPTPNPEAAPAPLPAAAAAADAAPALAAAATTMPEAAPASQAPDATIQAGSVGPASSSAATLADTAGAPATSASAAPVEAVPSPEAPTTAPLPPTPAPAAKGPAPGIKGEAAASSGGVLADDTAKADEADEPDDKGMTLDALAAAQTQAPAQPDAASATAAAAPASTMQVNHPHLQPQAASAPAPAPSDGVNAIGEKAKPAGPDQGVLPEHAKARSEDTKAEVRGAAAAETSAGEPGSSAKPGAAADQLAKTPFEQAAFGSANGPQHAATAASGNAAAPHGAQKADGPVPVIAQVPLGSVPVEIGLKGMAGVNRFEIRLDPADLGRIDVRLDIDKDGGVKAHLSVDKVETLMLLQRDARTLERAFEQAGLKPSDSGVELSLRDQQPQGQGRQEQGGDQRRDGPRWAGPDARSEGADSITLQPLPQRIWRGAVGVDVRI